MINLESEQKAQNYHAELIIHGWKIRELSHTQKTQYSFIIILFKSVHV